ncbi:MAG: hypothetical protein ACRDL8_07685 [Solirubrobacteraceae bacterium]
MLDALALCGWYHAACFVARATGLEPEPGAARFAGFLDDEVTPTAAGPAAGLH